MEKYSWIPVIVVLIALAVVSTSGCVNTNNSTSVDDKTAINETINSYFKDIDAKAGENATSNNDKYNMTMPNSITIENIDFTSADQAKATVKKTTAVATYVDESKTSGTTTTRKTGTEIDLNSPQWEEVWEFTLEKTGQVWKVVDAKMTSSNEIQ